MLKYWKIICHQAKISFKNKDKIFFRHSKSSRIHHLPIYISRNVKEEVLQPGGNTYLHKMIKNIVIKKCSFLYYLNSLEDNWPLLWVEFCPVPPWKDMLESDSWYVTLFGDRVFTEIIVKMRSLGWVLIQYDCNILL